MGYEAPTEGANPIVGWVKKPSDGEDAYGVYVKQYDEQHPEDPEHQSQDFMSRDQWLEYNRGKSAREIYNATYNKNLNDAQFAAELKMNYPMLHVGYDEDNAGATIGVPFDGNLDPTGDNIGASENTMGKLYLMPDAASDPENCIGFVTVLDGTYKWCNVGAIRIPSDVLAKSDVDNECTNGAVDKPASARVVTQLKNQVFGDAIVREVSENILSPNNDYFYSLQRLFFAPNNYSYQKGLSSNARNYLSKDLSQLKEKGVKLLIIPSSEEQTIWVTFRTNESVPDGFATIDTLVNSGCLSSIHNNNDEWSAIKLLSGETEYELDIPEDTKYVVFTEAYYDDNNYHNYHLPREVRLVTYVKSVMQTIEEVRDEIPKVIDNLGSDSTTNALSANQGKVLSEHIDEIDSRFITESRVDLSEQSKVLYYVASGTEVWTQGTNPMSHIALPVNPGDIFNIKPNKSFNTSYAFFTSDYDNIYNGNGEVLPALGETPPFVSGTGLYVLTKGTEETTITIPEGTKYLYLLYGNINGAGTYIPLYLSTITIKTIPEQAAINNGSFSGYISETGEFVGSKNYITTKEYSGSFNIKLMEGYKIVRVVLYDANNNMVNYNFVGSNPNKVMFSAYVENNAELKKKDCKRTEFGIMYIPEGFYVRIVIAKENGSVFNEGDVAIKSFYDLDSGGYKNELDTQQDGIKAAVRRAVNITSAYYYCLGKFPVKDNKYKNLFSANTVCTGIPYSLPREKNGLVGFGCNIKNFVTAIQNPRSVMYTENIKDGVSEYGISYIDYTAITNNSATYFGAVCSSLVNYIYGIRLSYQCKSMGVHTDEYQYLDREIYNLYNIPPLTAIQTPAHVFVILDFLTDKYGNRKFVIVAEEITPTSTLYVYSIEALQFRLDDLDKYYEIHYPSQPVRYLIPKDGLLESTKDNFVGSLFSFDTNDYRKNLPEIMTFTGDYASFSIGQSPIFLNALPSDKYNRLDLYYKAPNANDYSLLNSIDISSYTPDEIGMIYVNVTNYITSGGLYRARLSNSSDSSLVSDYTYFEAVKLVATVDNVSSSRKEINITEYSGATLLGKLFVYYWTPASDVSSGTSYSQSKDGFGYISQDEIDNNKIIINTSGLQYNLANSKVCVIMQGEYNQVQFSYDIPPLND